MKGVKELKRRLRGVGNIKKITRAMELVAATKLRRLQERALATRPFANKIAEMIRRVAGHVDPSYSPLLRPAAEVRREAVVIVGADRGLCGSYNANFFRHLTAHLRTLKEEEVTPEVWVLGKRPTAFLRKFGRLPEAYVHDEAVEKFQYADAKDLVRDLVGSFLDGGFQRARIAYTAFKSMARYLPTTADLLPVPREREEETFGVEYILEPSPAAIMDQLLPRFLEMQLYSAVLEALTSEFASRQIAMKNATDNADEMIDFLTMEYNKARQWGITAELLDIVGGAEALMG